MSAYAPAAPNVYRESAVLTASPEQLVVMLYDGANRFLTQSAIAMRDGRAGGGGERGGGLRLRGRGAREVRPRVLRGARGQGGDERRPALLDGEQLVDGA